MNNELEQLVSRLPEVYQPIWGRPDLSTSRSRGCEDRLENLLTAYNNIHNLLGRHLRVLDLGCAQGYFSHALANAGAEVVGIDYLAENIDVCQAIARERNDQKITFKCARVEEIIHSIKLGDYDIVLGLSVFHHMIEARGIPYVIECLDQLANKCECCIFEFATNAEPVHWAAAQPENVEDLLTGFSYVHLLDQHETHLSQYKRPLYFASSNIFYTIDSVFSYQKWSDVSNTLVPNSRLGRRRFYFSNDKIAKKYKISDDKSSQLEKNEWLNEVNFLSSNIQVDYKPKLYSHGCNDREAWLVRELYDGMTLDEFILNDKPYDAAAVIENVLKYLVQLEKHDLYHNDLRAWNTLICDDGSIRLIDYGAISTVRADCTWPHNLHLSFLIFCHEVLDRKVEYPIPTRPGWFNIESLPSPYNNMFADLFKKAPQSWSFTTLYEQIGRTDLQKVANDQISIPPATFKLIIELYEEADTKLRKHIIWLEDIFQQKDAEISKLNSTIQVSQEQTQELCREYEKTIAAQELECKKLANEKSELQNQLNAICTSKSWRIASMLRSIKRLFFFN